MKTERIQGQFIRCYDNGGKTADRFTVAYLPGPVSGWGRYECLGMNSEPFHPMGIGQHCTCTCGRHLGRRIRFSDLPKDCQKAVRQDLRILETLA